VYSKDEKVDCVGACVGVRGSRVKNIVSELQGEKIDIVRYADDIKEYIQAALSPAELSQIQIDSEERRANIIVADDQLSLAIGRHGQNVRLASQLVDWELNIFTAKQWDESQKEEDEDGEETAEESGEAPAETAVESVVGEKVTESSGDDELKRLEGVGAVTIAALKEKGYDRLEKIAAAGIADLTEVKGLGKIKAEKIIQQAKTLTEKE